MSIGFGAARVLRALLLLQTAAISLASYGQTRGPAPARAAWDCWYDGEVSVECRLRSADPSERPAAQLRRELDEARAETVALRRNNDRLPRVVAMMHEEPSAFAGRRVSIPLHVVPEDMEFVRQLAEAVMCGRNRACSIRFAESPVRVASMDLSELSEATD